MAITQQSPGPEYRPNKQDLELEKEPLPASTGCWGTRQQCWHRVWAGVGTDAARLWGEKRASQRSSASACSYCFIVLTYFFTFIRLQRE